MIDNLNFQDLMKKAQELQEDMKKKAEEAANEKHTITVGGDMVELVVNGRQEILSLKISPEAVDPNDIETLQDLMRSAFNQAILKTRNSSMETVNQTFSNFKFPGMP